jgi:hypothetical protein
MQGDEVQKQVAEVAKALYQRTDELAVLRARAITRHLWSSPLMFGCRRRGAAQIACTPSDRQQIGPTTWADAYNDVHCSSSPITVDRTPRAAFNRPI